MNSGMPLTEFVLETVIRDGLLELRANPVKLNYLFSRFEETQFNNQYGINKVNQIRTWLNRNEIKIVQAFSYSPTTVPCFSIQMVATEEPENRQTFDDHYETSFSNKTRDIVVDQVVATAYDSITGKLTITDSIDLSLVRINQVYVDSALNEFIIRSSSNILGNKYLNIGAQAEIDITDLAQILDPIDFSAYTRGQVMISETVRIGVHAKGDPHLTKFLYYILYSILKSRKMSLINRGIALDHSNISALDRAEEMGSDLVFTRFVDIKCLTEFNYLIDEVAAASSFDVNLFVPDPNPDSPTKRKL